MTLGIITIVIACFSLCVSFTTAWLTLLQKGTVKMTQPTMVFFGYDPDGSSKVVLRTLLYSTSKRNHIVEGMFAKLYRGESAQTFNIWAYRNGQLVRGSGVNVGPDGVVYYHHFLVPKDGTSYRFLSGDYTLEVYATLVNARLPLLLSRLHLTLSSAQATALEDKSAGVFFDWGPDSQTYCGHVDRRPTPGLRLG